jgi:hypothetical protein
MTDKRDESNSIDWTPEAGERLEKLISLAGGPKAGAKIAGRSDEALSRYRRGEARWDLWAVARLCLATGHHLDWLAFGNDTPEGQVSVDAVEEAAEFVLRAAREFPELQPDEVARSIARRARDLAGTGINLTEDPRVGDKIS